MPVTNMVGKRLAVLLAAAALGGCGRSPQGDVASSQPPPTFNKDIAPILFQHCASCHRPGQAAPFTLLTYGDAKPRAADIATVTTARHMPPWLPEAGGPAFVGERRLRDDQISTIERWARAGAVEGDPGDLPAPPVVTEGWQLGQPDVVVSMPQPYLLRPGTEDAYRNVVLRVTLPSSRFVRAVEFRPGTAPVHHAVIHLDRTSASRRRDGADGQPGFEGMGGPGTQEPDGQFLGWAPGRGPIVSLEGMPWRLDRGTDLVVELHLMPAKTATPVQPMVGLFFADQPPARVPLLIKMGSKAIEIPAGQRDYAITDSYVLAADVDLLSVYPHAHYLGKDIQVLALLPDRTTRPLLHIPRWSFHWQQDYQYVAPIALPRGTTITMRYTYDNSSDNEDNPRHPPQLVAAGPRSTDEMGNLLLQVLPHSSADRQALITESARHEALTNVAGAEMLVRRAPDDAENQRLLGASYADVGRSTEAIAHLEQAIRLNPRSASAHNDLGGVLLTERRGPEALAHFRRAVALAPDDEHWQCNLGMVLTSAGQLADAAAAFERALALNPEFADAHDGLGVVLFSQNRLDGATSHFRRAVELAPDSADYENDLGGALAEARQFDEALKHVRRALDLRPDYAPAKENLARLQRIGKQDGSRGDQ
jgi:tetratricopeptide (TPR) repeat protein/mono/diheme cytochrome c family protein